MPEYDADFYGWAKEQAALLRQGRLADADIANIAEEIESMGRSEKRELVNRLEVLMLHLLKWQYQPDRIGKSWRLTIESQRDRINDLLIDNPSLKPTLVEACERAYARACRDAEAETDLPRSTFPNNNPWSPEQLLDPGYYPA